MESIKEIATTINFLNLFGSNKYTIKTDKFAFTEIIGNDSFKKGGIVNLKDILTHGYSYEDLLELEKMLECNYYNQLAEQMLMAIHLRYKKSVLEVLYEEHKKKVEQWFMDFLAASKGEDHYNHNEIGTRFVDNLELFVQIMNSVFDSCYSYLEFKEEYYERLGIEQD